MTIYVRSATNEVQGILISPDRNSVPFRTSARSGSVTMQVCDQPYVLALSGADYSSETKYAVSIGANPATDGTELTTARINEPNDTETQTTPLFMAQAQLGYLGVYDLDFYSVFPILASEAILFDPPAGVYNSDQTVTITAPSGGTIRYTTDGSDPVWRRARRTALLSS
jgi:hypothetical protein